MAEVMGNKKRSVKLKICAQCERVKPKEKFPGGRGSLCSSCKSRNQQDRARYKLQQQRRLQNRLVRDFGVEPTTATRWTHDPYCGVCGATERIAI